MYRDSPFSRLQEMRQNRFVRRYHASTRKRCTAQDEFLEDGNRFFSEFSMPKSILGFAEHSLYVGIGLTCRLFTDFWYSTARKKESPPDYKSGRASSMTPEKKMIYEVFKLLDTHKVVRDRKVSTYCKSNFDVGQK